MTAGTRDEVDRGPGGAVRARLAALGLRLHGPHPPHDPLDAVVVHGGMARTSGQLPRIDGELTCIGTLGDTVSVEEGAGAAAVCALNALSVLEVALGSLDRIERVLTVTGYVASTPDFHRQPDVVDGASDVLVQVFGEAGRHTRSAIGVASLPRGGAVEIESPWPSTDEPGRAARAPGRRPPSLAALGAATLGESGARPMPPRIRPVWPGATVAAPAYPVRCTPGDNLAVHVAVSRAPSGSVLVVDVGDVSDRGYWGEVLTTGALARGIGGLVIDGGVRDVAALERLGFPVFSRTVALRGATKVERGAIGSPVDVAGVPVAPGDWVVGDVDGVVVVPGDRVRRGDRRGPGPLGGRGAATSPNCAPGPPPSSLLGLDASLIEDGGPG